MPLTRSLVVVLAAAVALITVGLLRFCPGLAAAWVAACTLAIPVRGYGPAGLAALPTLLAALPSPLPLARSPEAGPVHVVGTVIGVRRDFANGTADLQVAAHGRRFALSIELPCAALPGDRIEATARCTAAAIPEGTATLRAATSACKITTGAPSLPRACTALRLALEAQLHALLPLDAAQLVSALVLGSDARVPNELAAAHRATGLSHLLAVSGAHAAMLSMLLGLQPFAGGRRRRSSRLHLCLAMGLLLVYGAITGLEPPVFRALVSYTIGAIGMRTGRSLGAAAGLAWPALISCLVAPHGVLGASFCLSYAAVAGLWLAGPPRSETWVERFVLAPVRASFWATALTAPLTLGWFGQLAPWTVLLTPVLAPLVAAILFLGLFTSVGALLLPPLGALLAPPLAAAATLYVTAVEHANALPATPVFAWCAPSWLALALGALAGAATVALWRTRNSVLLGCACAAIPHFLPPFAPEHSVLHLFAIGHGQCCLVTTRDGSNVVLDCGSLQYLALPPRRIDSALQRRCIDLLVLTHADRDHTGSVPDLSGRVPIRRAIVPASMADHPAALALRSQGCAITLLQPGETLEPLPGFLVAAPRDPGEKCNDTSLWTTVDLDGIAVQLPGDAQQAGIAAAIADGIAQRADVLVLPHHGRPEVTIETLLDVVDPRVCLVSNRTGEDISVQGAQILRRGIPTFATGMCGSLRLEGGVRPNLASAIGLPLPQRPPLK